jgi:type IV secretory pathway VirB9-like protein
MKAIFAVLAVVAGIGTASAATQFDYDYWTNSAAKPAWMPKSIKSDGQKTYIQFPDANLLAPPKPGEVSLAPSLVVLKPTTQGDTAVYRYKVVGDRYEVMGVIEKAVLIGPSGDEHDRVLIQHGPAPTTDSK